MEHETVLNHSLGKTGHSLTTVIVVTNPALEDGLIPSSTSHGTDPITKDSTALGRLSYCLTQKSPLVQTIA
jgi:hypothetical protein